MIVTRTRPKPIDVDRFRRRTPKQAIEAIICPDCLRRLRVTKQPGHIDWFWRVECSCKSALIGTSRCPETVAEWTRIERCLHNET
jgi:hypothetical protein